MPLLSSEQEKCELAELNLIAGKKAKAAAAFEAALRYFNLGIEVLNSSVSHLAAVMRADRLSRQIIRSRMQCFSAEADPGGGTFKLLASSFGLTMDLRRVAGGEW